MSKKKEVTIQLKEFDMSSIEGNRIILFIGKRNTGKTVLLQDYLYYNQDIPYACCISPTDNYNLSFRPHIPSKFIFEEVTPELIESFLNRQKRISARRSAAKSGNGDPKYTNVDNRGILIMDDCLADVKDWKNDKNIKWIFTNGRHVGVILALTMQYQLGITPMMRTNIDYIFICKETKKIEKEKLWKYYAGMFDTFDMFNQVFNACTENYGCMVIDNTTQSSELSEQVFWYKADLHDDFRICYGDFWENNNDYIKKDYPEDTATEQVDDYQKYLASRNKVKYNLSVVPNVSQEEQEIQRMKQERQEYSDFQKRMQMEQNQLTASRSTTSAEAGAGAGASAGNWSGRSPTNWSSW